MNAVTMHPEEGRPPRRLLLSVRETCQALNLGRTMLYQLVTAKELRPVKVGKRTLFVAEEVTAWAARLPRLRGDQLGE